MMFLMQLVTFYVTYVIFDAARESNYDVTFHAFHVTFLTTFHDTSKRNYGRKLTKHLHRG